MEVSSSSLSLHRIDFGPPIQARPMTRFQSRPTTRISSTSSSYFGVSILCPHKNLKPRNKISISRKKLYQIVAAGVFERFIERSIKSVMYSQIEAKALGKDMVFTQHLLLGLIVEDKSIGGFLESGIGIEDARIAVKSIWNDDGETGVASSSAATDVAFSNSTKRVFEAANEYSRSMGYKFIAPEHIVIGLLTIDDGSATTFPQN